MCGGVFLSPDLPGHLLFKTFGVAKPLLNIGMSGPQCQELSTSLKYQRITVTTLKFCIILHIHHLDLYHGEITFVKFTEKSRLYQLHTSDALTLAEKFYFVFAALGLRSCTLL